MAVEAGGTTGIIDPMKRRLAYVVTMRGLDAETVRQGFLYSDADAEYAATLKSISTRFGDGRAAGRSA